MQRLGQVLEDSGADVGVRFRKVRRTSLDGFQKVPVQRISEVMESFSVEVRSGFEGFRCTYPGQVPEVSGTEVRLSCRGFWCRT